MSKPCSYHFKYIQHTNLPRTRPSDLAGNKIEFKITTTFKLI